MRRIKILVLGLSLLLLFPFAACGEKSGSPKTYGLYGFDQSLFCPPGTFCLKDIFLTEEIQTEDQVYRSETAYLVVRAEFDFENYALQECGVTLYNYDSSDDESLYYRINYFQTDRGSWSDEIGRSEDLDLPLTQALSTDLHLDGEPGPVQGTAWLCFHVPAEIQDYLYEQIPTADPSLPKPPSFELEFNLNQVGDPNVVDTSIGCHFYQIDVYETYPIEA